MRPSTNIAHARVWIVATLFAVLLAGAVVADAGAAVGHERTAAKKGKKRPPPHPLYWGAQVGRQFTGEQPPWDMNALYAFEALARKNVSLVSFASPFAECDSNEKNCTLNRFPTTPLEDIRAHGAIPFFSWNTGSNLPGYEHPNFKLARIVDGTYDAHIREFAERARDWEHPFFLRLNWEMNGFWFSWNEGVNGNRKGQFVAAWRHIHDIFTTAGARNVTWVWCPNVDFTRKLNPLHGLYPGDAYVDWTCLDGFNWGNRPNSGGWQNFNQIFHSTYKRVLKIARHKPMVIGEMASDDRGGSKAAWIRHTLKIVPAKYRHIYGFIWYDQKDQGMHWPIESTKASKRAFARWIGKSVYQTNHYGDLETDGPIPAPSW